jgi:hypothetical protein
MGFTDTRGKFWYHGNGISIQTQGGFIMTKLFSMKSLAFAGAAAFALTLAAAPQVDAAEVTADVDYNTGTLEVKTGVDQLTETDDGYVIYYQANKNGTFKAAKYSAIALPKDQKKIDISNLMGTATKISLSVDGKEDGNTTAELKASPKIKATYDATKKEITLNDAKGATDDSKIGTNVNIASGGSLFVAQVKTGTYGSWENVEEDTISTIVDQAKALGTTLYIRVAKGTSENLITPWSKEVKVKISAQAKAPKATLKLSATKFTWKISDKQQYKIKVVETDVTTEWKTGNKRAIGWTTLFTDAGADNSVVSGDAITADIKIYFRTNDGKKAASAINVIDLKKSAASPTSSAIEVKIKKAGRKTNGSVKTPTAASITVGTAGLQYSDDNGTTWKKVTNKTKFKDFTKEILVRVPGKDNTTLPSLSTHITFDANGETATLTPLVYNANNVVEAGKAEEIKATE